MRPREAESTADSEFKGYRTRETPGVTQSESEGLRTQG
jgi:hypothetical protein